ncbi:MAG: hypothetical protein ACLUE1_02595 [Adlercreutzia equolifaciens]
MPARPAGGRCRGGRPPRHGVMRETLFARVRLAALDRTRELGNRTRNGATASARERRIDDYLPSTTRSARRRRAPPPI